MDTRDHIVAIGLLTQEDVRRLGENFSRLYPVPHDGAFDDLIKAIDEADRQRDPQPKGRRRTLMKNMLIGRSRRIGPGCMPSPCLVGAAGPRLTGL